MNNTSGNQDNEIEDAQRLSSQASDLAGSLEASVNNLVDIIEALDDKLTEANDRITDLESDLKSAQEDVARLEREAS